MGCHTAFSAPRQRGIAIIEMTIILPFLLLMLALTVDFGRIFYETSLLQGRVNAAVRYLTINAPAGNCNFNTSDGDVVEHCETARNLVLNALDDEAAHPRFQVETSSMVSEGEDHWKVSARYQADFILKELLPETLQEKLTINVHAIQRSMIMKEGTGRNS
ncbi:TadE/TadG family type IV pilus assembly protein [Endozoicomonas sp.]|uniref:TadE/TadG family type IV pilus assembly protein n=1 Tax=Endozoicomonas sp. TaxID=1892382 RepID=UPI003AF65E6F